MTHKRHASTSIVLRGLGTAIYANIPLVDETSDAAPLDPHSVN